jgi:hypothetical protein
MEKAISHVHVRRFAAPRTQLVALIDELWSRSSRDGLPRQLHGWRRNPEGSAGMAVGTRFGHGPFSFEVEQWDGQTLRARIETAGFRGHHGFVLRVERDEVVVSHELHAELTLLRWLLWQLFLARGHDWAVESLFDRMHVLLGSRQPSALPAPPLGMRAFAALRQLAR